MGPIWVLEAGHGSDMFGLQLLILSIFQLDHIYAKYSVLSPHVTLFVEGRKH